jgi:hypothetical protein
MRAALVKTGTWELHLLRQVHERCTVSGKYMGAALVKVGTWELHWLKEVHGSCTV